MNKLYIVTLIFLITLAGCSSEQQKLNLDDPVINNPEYGSLQNNAQPPFDFEQVDTFSFTEGSDLLISGFAFFNVDNTGNMYFYDRQQNKLISADNTGKIRWVTGQKGKGPGDFDRPSGMILEGNEILVFNVQGSRIDRFDLNGQFIRTIPISEGMSFPSPIGFTDNGWLVTRSTLWGKLGTKISVISFVEDSLQIEAQFDIDQANNLEVPNGVSSATGITLINFI